MAATAAKMEAKAAVEAKVHKKAKQTGVAALQDIIHIYFVMKDVELGSL